MKKKVESFANRSYETSITRLNNAAVLIPVLGGDSFSIIFTKRSLSMRTHSGEVAFPGGRSEPEDATLLDTALREAQEEIGLPAEKVEVLGQLSNIISLHGLNVTPFAGKVPSDFTPSLNPDEIDCIFKVPVSFFLDPANRCDHLPQYRSKARFAPCYLWEGHLIWGLTAYILAEFLNLAYDAEISLPVRDYH